MVGELGKVIGALMSFFVYLQHIIMLATYIFLAFIANWQFAILVAIGGSLSNLFYKYINSYTKEKATLLSSKGNSFNAVLIQILHNFKYLNTTNENKHFYIWLDKNKLSLFEQNLLNTQGSIKVKGSEIEALIFETSPSSIVDIWLL